MLRFSESSLYSQCSNQAARSETENLGIDSGQRKRQPLHHIGFGAHVTRWIPVVYNRERNIWDEKFNTYISRVSNWEKHDYVNSMRVSKIFRSYVVRVFVFCKFRVVGLVVGY